MTHNRLAELASDKDGRPFSPGSGGSNAKKPCPVAIVVRKGIFRARGAAPEVLSTNSSRQLLEALFASARQIVRLVVQGCRDTRCPECSAYSLLPADELRSSEAGHDHERARAGKAERSNPLETGTLRLCSHCCSSFTEPVSCMHQPLKFDPGCFITACQAPVLF